MNSYLFGFNGKEKDDEVKGSGNSYDFGARMYDSRVGRWLSRDPLEEKYVGHSPYNFAANNPIFYIDPDGRYIVGTNGKRIDVFIDENGSITLSKNATKHVKRLVSMIEKSTDSEIARSQLLRLADNDTKIHLKLSSKRKRIKRWPVYGIHKPHNKSGKALEWDMSRYKGRFTGEPEYIKDEDGDWVYKEATIIIFTKNIENLIEVKRAAYKDPEMTREEAIIGTFVHEVEHDLDKEQIEKLKDRMEGKTEHHDEEKKPYKIQEEYHEEVKRNRKE